MKSAPSPEELLEIAREEGTELADEELSVSGGARLGAGYCEEDMYCRQDGLDCPSDHYCRDLALGCGTKCEALM